ncbi:MAG: flagellar motor switch protein FliG [Nannocystales bacterium]
MNNALTEQQRAAALILSLDQVVARTILRHLDDNELRQLTELSAMLPKVKSESVEEVARMFCSAMKLPLSAGAGGEYARQLVTDAVGEERAQSLFLPPREVPPALEALRGAHAPTLAELLTNEHPQIAAVLLTQLPPEKAAQVLEVLPNEKRMDLIGRIVELEEVPMQQVEIVSEELARALEAAGGIASLETRNEFDSIRFTAGVLNEITSELREPILEGIEERESGDDDDDDFDLDDDDDDDLDDDDDDGDEGVSIAQQIRDAMFTFEDLARLSVREVQLLMREVDKDTILVALKTANDELRDHLLSGVSSRAAKQIVEELPLLPPTKLSEVEKAQRDAVEVVIRLSEAGQINMPGAGGEEMV